MALKSIPKELLILVGISVAAALAVNFVSPKGIALIGQWDTTLGVISAGSRDDVVDHDLEIQTVDLAKKIYDRDEAVFLDARPEDDYEAAHVKGAVSLPVNRFDRLIAQFKEKYPRETRLVTYCSGRECDDSHRLAQRLFEQGYLDVSVFIDGFPGWKERGYPVE